jgi:hypothetical protein
MIAIVRFLRRRAAAVSFCLVVAGVLLASLFDRWLEGLGSFLAASTSPAFASVPPSNFTPGSLTAANTAMDGTGTTLLLATAPATASGGSLVESIRCMHLGTNVATVVRVFWNNGSTPATAGNNSLIAEKTMPANTLTQTAESLPQDIVINQTLKANATTPERIYVVIGTAVAAGIKFTAKGGDL